MRLGPRLADSVPTKFFGALSHQPRWGLTPRGWFFLAGGAALLSLGFLLTIHPFLAVTQRVDSSILVVEGWISPGSTRLAGEEFRNGHYSRIYVTGGPIEGDSASEYRTYAEQGYTRLGKHGMTSNQMAMIPAEEVRKDRTFTSAVALREYFRTNAAERVESFNVFTSTAHARRSRLLFEKAFPRGTRIGIIACPPIEYDDKRWWMYSAGVQEIVSETAGYLYARLFFWPAPPPE